MSARFALAVALLAAAGLALAATAPMGYADARHLLARTGFGPTDAEVRSFAGLTREQAVTALLRDVRTTAATPPPAWALATGPIGAPRGDNVSEEVRRAYRQLQIRQDFELRGWWLQEMLATPSPLTERMTLFWHNHFVSSQQKVRVARFMYTQNTLLRAHALGNFGTLLHAVAKDPAMLIYLDTAQSRKAQPNENFAREVMELFTLGEGRYGEQDIKEAARAFTGWSIDRETGQYLFRPGAHDYGVKTVLGTSGRFDGDAVLDVLLARPETSEFVTAKLWREFVSPEPDAREVRRIAKIFREQNLDVKVALRALLLADAFWTAENRGALVKSPVELVVGTLRQLELAPAAAAPFAIAATGMGQVLLSPPNVKGWPGGDVWINSTTLLARKQFLDRLVRAADAPAPAMMTVANGAAAAGPPATGEAAMMSRTVDAAPPVTGTIVNGVAPPPTEAEENRARARRAAQALERGMRNLQFDATTWVAQRQGSTPAAKMDAAQALLLPLPAVTADAPAADTDAAGFVRATLLDPAYQLK
jgi:uncharacterized protein (DUF1800 family)